MAKVNNTQDRELMESMTLSWEALPELAKDRWEQAVGYDIAVETQLAKAKSTRSEAELERQRVANEILEATREVCKSIIIDSKRSLEKARRAESEAESKLLESQAMKIEAEAFYENARQRAEELVNQSRAAADRESMEIKQQSTLEAQRMLAHVEAIRSAAKEELEAQRIYVETARLKLEARGILSQLQEELAGPDYIRADGANGHAPSSELLEEWPGVGQAEPVPNQEEEASSEVETLITNEEKNGSRRTGSSG